MLNRRILRIKAFKVLYSYAENQGMSLKEAQAQLDLSCKATRDLYLFMLSIISPLTAEARARAEAARSKFKPTEEERNPNMKFINNRIAPILDNDPDFQKIIAKEKLSWEQYDVLLRKLYDSIRGKEWYNEYMASPEASLEEDVALFIHIFEEEFVDNADLADILEDLSIYWNDDLAYALTWVCKTVENLASNEAQVDTRLYNSAIQLLDTLDRSVAVLVDERGGLDPDSLRGYATSLRAIQQVLSSRPTQRDIDEQMARIEKLRRDAASKDEQADEIVVTFGGGAEMYGD